MMRPRKTAAFLVLSVTLIALGFNTLDCMVNTFAWSEPTDGTWYMNTWLVMDFWNAYALFGVIPFAIGMFALGMIFKQVVNEK